MIRVDLNEADLARAGAASGLDRVLTSRAETLSEELEIEAEADDRPIQSRIERVSGQSVRLHLEPLEDEL